MQYMSINPATEELIKEYKTATEDEIELTLARSLAGFNKWRKEPIVVRAACSNKASELLNEKATQLGELICGEMGKPLRQAISEVRKCASLCVHFAGNAQNYLSTTLIEAGMTESVIRYDPLGPLLAIMPWNFPFWQVFRFSIPALCAGNAVLLKHAPNTPGCALAIEKLMEEAGYPEGVFQNLFLSNEQAARVLSDKRVRGVTLTGSPRAGKAVAEAAGKNLKKVVLELGGNDPFIVFEDVDLEDVADTAALARCLNSGQVCVASKRFLVEKSVCKKFVEIFVQKMNAQVIGDPRKNDVTIGPLARADLRDRLISQVDSCIRGGAELLCGGKIPERLGFYYPPTVLLANKECAMDFVDEELFGPVAIIVPFSDEAEAIAIANATCYGLGATIWTKDLDRAKRLVPEIEVGNVFVNNLVKSDPKFPFGGIKSSGFGRELGHDGMREFVNIKTVWIKK